MTLRNEAGTTTWNVGCCIEVLTDGFIAELMYRVTKRSNLKWRYPTGSDTAIAEPDQILNCVVDGEWNILSNRNSEFLLSNHETIHKKFLEAM